MNCRYTKMKTLYIIHITFIILSLTQTSFAQEYKLMRDIRKNSNVVLFDKDTIIPFDTVPQLHDDSLFICAHDEIVLMLYDKKEYDIKRAIFLVENAFCNGTLNYKSFVQQIDNEVFKINAFIDSMNIRDYRTAPNAAIFHYFTKPYSMNNNRPFTYNHLDYDGEKDFTNLFVSKLINTHQGQCQSMPLYYMILCRELGGEAFLSVAPNHLFIKHIDENGNWCNVELTTGTFSRDKWYIEAMEISERAISSRTYLAPLSKEEEIAFIIHFLCSAYTRKYTDCDYFTLTCAENILNKLHFNCNGLFIKYCTLNQWRYDYNKINNNDFSSQYIKAIYSELYKTKCWLTTIGFSQISTNKYIENVKNLYHELGKKAPKSILDMKQTPTR